MSAVNEPNTPYHYDSFLPDFCGLSAVFAVVLLAELFAIILTLAGGNAAPLLWERLAMTSLFMQWVALTSAAVLCASRRLLCRLRDEWVGLISYGLLLLVILGLSEAAYRILGWVGAAGSVGGHGEFLLRNGVMGALISAIALRYFYVQSQWRRGLRAESEARFQALQARMRPHFLFNTMNSIASLIRIDAERAEGAVEDLAELIRASIGDGRSLIPLADELRIIRHYLSLEGLRLGERLQVAWTLDEQLERVPVLPLSLQPLVENAVYHGIERSAEGGWIRIRAEEAGGQLVLEVSNRLPEPGATAHQGHRMAVENLRQRLQHQYGGDAALVLGVEGDEFRACLTLPLEGGEG